MLEQGSQGVGSLVVSIKWCHCNFHVYGLVYVKKSNEFMKESRKWQSSLT